VSSYFAYKFSSFAEAAMTAAPSYVHRRIFPAQDAARDMDETAAVEALLPLATLPAEATGRIRRAAAGLVQGVRASRRSFGMVDAFLQAFGLDTGEGVALMCLAEALLRIPDARTADALIRDKVGGADWARHIGQADSLLVNASTWALLLTGRVVTMDEAAGPLGRLLARTGEPAIRRALKQAMRIMGRQFVMGRDIASALKRAAVDEKAGYTHSFDMLGEGARTAADASRCFDRYVEALGAIAHARQGRALDAAPGLSVKLSALHPRYEEAQAERALPELLHRLSALCRLAKNGGVSLTVDAEESERLDLHLDLIEAAAADPALSGWNGLGFALQAYQKRALAVVDRTADLAERSGLRLMVRLVKGAYWDSEIKRAQERGLPGYPVFTRKANTDASYLACARKLLDLRGRLYPMFATHNAHTVAAVLEMAEHAGAATAKGGFEFQRLHGMGEPLYHQLVGGRAAGGGAGGGAVDGAGRNLPCRIYAPVGGHEDLLAYLVRRLLENGANTSFVNRLQNDKAPVAEIVADPVAVAAAPKVKSHPRIPLPADLFGTERRNAAGLDLNDRRIVARLNGDMRAAVDLGGWTAGAENEAGEGGVVRPVLSPNNRDVTVGTVTEASAADAGRAMAAAFAAARDWGETPATDRADILDRAGDFLEEARAALMALLVWEAGKTIPDALAEVREAVDFCRYYAARTRADFAVPQPLPGTVGEANFLSLHGRGVFVCISPWNFPLAIFIGQVAAALAAGNTVVAKPAPQTPLVAAHAVRLLHDAGVPLRALHLTPGGGAVGAALVGDPRTAGVAFTGSTLTARRINAALAARGGPIVPLIAETGGLNALVADSSALAEQLTDDVITSAFRSAGQRCSALRVLLLPTGSADKVLEMLAGAAAELRLGDPSRLSTDIGPVIDEAARDRLEAHAAHMAATAKPLFRAPVGDAHPNGVFFAPRAFEIDSAEALREEVFGPILHVVRYRPDRLAQALEAVGAAGYGLTLGIHSRINSFISEVRRALPVGNTYVNRNIVGATVGCQPFGGEGLSGTGFKAGGPHYLLRFAVERTLTVNTAAAGGDASLVSLGES
jgi:RHH-type transcriptional regulator, proline utilization regulon repressor / proline dehydrogenase / delta 1-pyrroline-5-carboxylate dehydrogenase